ncbi:hypothetical protein B0T09DRAFT_73280 [Sordaria sp. MPI-SDFR-AT-0083]|nr:hypothetical protein B0T09DRAFT_73280 [Sordaria sp. MPI-SDFR-AT-0083]
MQPALLFAFLSSWFAICFSSTFVIEMDVFYVLASTPFSRTFSSSQHGHYPYVTRSTVPCSPWLGYVWNTRKSGAILPVSRGTEHDSLALMARRERATCLRDDRW